MHFFYLPQFSIKKLRQKILFFRNWIAFYVVYLSNCPFNQSSIFKPLLKTVMLPMFYFCHQLLTCITKMKKKYFISYKHTESSIFIFRSVYWMLVYYNRFPYHLATYVNRYSLAQYTSFTNALNIMIFKITCSWVWKIVHI